MRHPNALQPGRSSPGNSAPLNFQAGGPQLQQELRGVDHVGGVGGTSASHICACGGLQRIRQSSAQR